MSTHVRSFNYKLIQHIHVLGQSYNANDIINADIGKTIHPKFSEFRMKVKPTFLLHNH